jgi:hypothetical protein
MSQTMHILRKDVRRLRWLLALWLVLLTVRVLLAVNGAAAADESVATGLLLQRLWDTLWAIELILAALIVTQVVHEEPLVGFTAFWLTRPYVRTVLLGEKLLFASVVLIALPLIADLLMLSLFNAGPRALARAGATAVLGDALWMLSLMVLAVLTPSLAAFVLTALGIVAAAWTLVAVAGFFSIWNEPAGYTPPAAPDATPVVVMIAMYLCAAFSVVVYQYHHRRWRVAAGLAVAGLAASVATATFWPWPFARGEQVRAGTWASSVAVAHDPSWGTRVSDVVNVSRQMGERWRRVSARFTVSGLPPQMAVQWTGIRSRLQFPDGSDLESAERGGSGWIFSRAAAEAALGARVLVTHDFDRPAEWSPMITVRDRELLPYRGRAGRLDADIDIHLMQMREVATVPLMPGVSVDRGTSRLDVRAVQLGVDSLNVVIQRWHVQSPLSVDPYVQEFFALRRRSTGEALMGGVDNSWQLGGGGGLMPLPVGGFSVGSLYLRFPGPGYGIPKDLDIASFDDAELVILEMAPAGVVTRRLTIDPFVVPAR